MDRILFQNESPERRLGLLRDNSEGSEQISYMRNFSAEELAEMKDELAEESITLSDIDARKREAMAEFKEEAKPHSERLKTLLENIRNKAELVDENCYKIVDLEQRMVGFYNSRGELVMSRPAKANELTKNMFAMTGTNNR